MVFEVQVGAELKSQVGIGGVCFDDGYVLVKEVWRELAGESVVAVTRGVSRVDVSMEGPCDCTFGGIYLQSSPCTV